MMNKRAVRTGLSMLALALSALAAAAQLNPTVKVLSKPTSPVPAECIEGTAPQAQPRVDVAQIPEAPKQKPMKAPPSASLRGLLEETQLAAGRGDRNAFRDALARAKASLENFPTGGERNIATEIVGIYDDVDRIWSYQFDTPSGAFFEAGTVPAEIMKKYPGYEKAIAGQVFAASGHRFYPTVETREYLLREAAPRLNRLGISVAAPAARESRAATGAAAPAVKTTHVTPHVTEKPATQTEVATTHAKPAVKAATKTSKPAPHHATRSATSAPVSSAAAKPAAKAVEKRAEKPAVTPTAPAVKPEPPKGAATETAKSGSMSTHAPAKTEAPVKVAEAPKSAALPAASQTPAAVPLIPTTATTPASSPATSTTTAPAPAVPTIATDTATTASITHPIATETTEPAVSTDTTDSTGTAAKPGKQGKSVILPIILIVVGIGVLIVLFRASS